MPGKTYRSALTRTRVNRRRAIAGGVALAAGAAAVSAGCMGGGKSAEMKAPGPNDIPYLWQLPPETKGIKPGGTLRTAVTSGISGTLDPMTNSSFTVQVLASSVYDTLLMTNSGPMMDPSSPDARKLLGGLAESYEVSADAVSYTLRLRPDVKFHNVAPVNGRVMDIDDWRTSFERHKAVSPYRANLDVVDKIEQPDQRTLVLKMKEPYAPFLRALTSGTASFFIMPKELNADPQLAALNTIGTAYQALAGRTPDALHFEKHPEYWNGAPYIDRWSSAIIPDYAERYAAFASGDIATFDVNQNDVLRLRAEAPAARIIRGGMASYYHHNFFGLQDFETSPWRDERVRWAMRMSVDWPAIGAALMPAEEFAAAGMTVETRMHTHVKAVWPQWLDPAAGKLGEASRYFLYDLAEAKALMKAAGFEGGIDLDGYYNGGTEYAAIYRPLVQAQAEQWAKSGLFRVDLQPLPYAQFLPNIYQKRDFKGVVLTQPEFPYNEVDLELYNWYHSKGARSKWPSDPKLDDLIEKQRREIDAEKRAGIIYDLQKYMTTKMYTFPGVGTSGRFDFRWPWWRNSNDLGHRQWLAADAPNRGG